MTVCRDCYKKFNTRNEISLCCDCSSDLWLMESSSHAPFYRKLILIFLYQDPSKRNCFVKKKPSMKLNHGESCCLVGMFGTSPLVQTIGVFALVIAL